MYRQLNVKREIDFVEGILGQDWLKSNLKTIKEMEGGKVSFGCGLVFNRIKVPAIAYCWYKAREEIALAELVGSDQHGPYTLLMASVGADIGIIKNCKGFDGVLKNLQHNVNSLQALYEILAAVGYVKKGYDICFKELKEKENYAFHLPEGKSLGFSALSLQKLLLRKEKIIVLGKAPMVFYLFRNDAIFNDTLETDYMFSPVFDEIAANKVNVPVAFITVELMNNNGFPGLNRLGRLLFKSPNMDNNLLYIPNDSFIG